MDPLVTVPLVAAAGYGAYVLARKAGAVLAGSLRPSSPPTPAELALLAAERRRREQMRLQRAEAQRRNLHAQALQVALFQLNRAPDFRRVAKIAAAAGNVPVAFRQRQFRRFRPRMVAFMAMRLQAGGDTRILGESLAELLGHLGMAPFEADYIRSEAEQRLAVPRPAPPVPYAQRVARLQRQHAERVASLRQLSDLDAETRERLIETEESRFQQALQHLSANELDA